MIARCWTTKARASHSNSCSLCSQPKYINCSLSVATNARPFLRSRSRNSGSNRAVPTNAIVDSIGWLGGLEDVDESKFKIERGDNGSVVASGPVADGESVASIPGSVWLTRQAALKSPIGQYVETLDPWLSIAIFLMHEKNSKKSMWAEYIELLCSKPPSTPILWKDSEVELLKGTQIWESVFSYRNFYKETYEALRQKIFEPNAGVFPLNEYSQEEFLWAACIVRALSHTPLDGENIALVPTLESLGHKRGEKANVNLEIRSGGLFGGSESLGIKATRAIPQGTPMAFDYAPTKTEGHVLLNHGTMDPESPGTFAITLVLPEDDGFYDDKLDILEMNNLEASSEFVLRTGSPPEDNMIAMLRLINLEGPDAFLLESIFRNEIWEHLNLPISEPNERAVYESMATGCSSVLQSCPTRIEEDIDLLKSIADKMSNEAMAISIRLGEKEVLEAALRYFEGRMSQLEDFEYYSERRLKRLGLLDKEGKPTDWDSFFEDGIA
eukprot:jgi/Picsp_1/729/NSC_04218-R1_rubisco large subunit n-methyltransferase